MTGTRRATSSSCIGELNRLRRERPALKRYDNLRFQDVTGERTLFYRKAMAARQGRPTDRPPAIAGATRCTSRSTTDPTAAEHAILHPDLPAVGIGWDEPYRLTDLLTGRVTRERGADVSVDLDPAGEPFRIFTVGPADA